MITSEQTLIICDSQVYYDMQNVSVLKFFIYLGSEQPIDDNTSSPSSEEREAAQPNDTSSTYVYDNNYHATVQRSNNGLLVM